MQLRKDDMHENWEEIKELMLWSEAEGFICTHCGAQGRKALY